MPLVKREREARHSPLLMFDRFFANWPEVLRPMMALPYGLADILRVDEYREDGVLVIRAEAPGIDPEKDIEITVDEGVLHICAERREEEKEEQKNYYHHELRYGSFRRDLVLPDGVKESDIKASYKDGVLEIRVEMPEAAKAVPTATKVPIATT